MINMGRCAMWVVLAGLVTSQVSALSCGDAVSALAPCGLFLLGAGAPTPTPRCCSIVQSLNKQAVDTATRRSLCRCLKDSGPSFGVKPEKARLLPSLCKLTLQIPISPNVDCSRLRELQPGETDTHGISSKKMDYAGRGMKKNTTLCVTMRAKICKKISIGVTLPQCMLENAIPSPAQKMPTVLQHS